MQIESIGLMVRECFLLRFESSHCFLKQVDKLGLREQCASLYLQIGRLAEAEEIYRKLLDYNPDNYLYVIRLTSRKISF